MNEEMTPGQAAFEKWNALVPASNRVFTQWAQLPDVAQEGWEEVAAMAIETHRGLNACSCRRPSVNP